MDRTSKPSSSATDVTDRTKPQPRDGPATTFIPDPVVKDLIALDDGYYGIVVNTLWPPPEELTAPYSNSLLPEIRKCFDAVDLVPTSDKNNNKDAPVYIYPPDHLHVTIATLSPIVKRDLNNPKLYDDLKTKWENILELASQHDEWPDEALQFEIDRAQIGNRAGILLWKETTGGLQKMRECLKNEVASHDDLTIYNVPGIAHTSFLRFQSVPTTSGEIVQERFAANVLPKLNTIFPKPITATWAKMACEWIPYMHFPDNDHFVFSTVHVKSKST
mmetsp:Transcript_1197/g.2823  ORF Transcript_1197/g.2823 Transcript_1197/m.2823 type:complete len:275 (-) Transcript_1197:78-902(-)